MNVDIKKYLDDNCVLKTEYDEGLDMEFLVAYSKNGFYITASKDKHTMCAEKGILHLLASHNITEVYSTGMTANYGYSETEGKWFGWSHRAWCSFGIGSEVKKGDCAYKSPNKEDYEESMLRFYEDEYKKNIRIGYRGVNSFRVRWEYTNDVPNVKVRGKRGGVECTYPLEWGRGEWKAETIDDAKQMAIDFAESVA